MKSKKNNKKSKKVGTWLYVLTGVIAGFLNGLFGGGGGMVLVPMLIYLLKIAPRKAHATAIFLILPLSLLSGLFYASFGTFNLSVGIPTLIGVVVGGLAGAILLSKISSKWILIIFAIVMASAGVKMLLF